MLSLGRQRQHFYEGFVRSRVAITDIDGRGNSVEAVEGMWERMVPPRGQGIPRHHSGQVVETKTKKVAENFQITDPERAYLKPGEGEKKAATGEHRPPTAHEFKLKDRVKLES